MEQSWWHIRLRNGWLLIKAESIDQFVQLKNDSNASPFKTLAISENGGEGTMVGWTYGSLEFGSGLAQGIKWIMNWCAVSLRYGINRCIKRRNSSSRSRRG